MAAMLERHARDGKPTPSEIPIRETIPCPKNDCPFSYSLSYTEAEHFLIPSESELNTDKMRRLAIALIEKVHPMHSTRNYIWKGAELGWVEADSMAARKTL
jgi:hypothetical protein